MNETKTYTLRTLESKDLFLMFKLISKFGFDDFKKCFNAEDIRKLVNEQGEIQEKQLTTIVGMNVVFDIASIVISNLSKCENEIYDFLAGISNMKRKEIEKLSPALFTEMIIDVIQKEEFGDFIRVVSRLFK